MSAASPRVVSTSPSGTEILACLGVEPVAVSHACDFPPGVTDLPRINTSRVDADGSADRDSQATGDVYDVDVETLRAVEPEIILSQSVCGVCAVDEALVERHLDDLAVEPDVVGLQASSLGGVYDCIHEVGRVVGREERADELVGEMLDCVDTVRQVTSGADERPSVAVLEWLDPIHVAANWVPELVDAAGGDYPLADPGERSTEPGWDAIRDVDPDVIVIAPCSFDEAATRANREELTGRPGWDDLTAVQEDQVFVLDGQVLNRWTPRLAGELEVLASILHPDLFEGVPVAARF